MEPLKSVPPRREGNLIVSAFNIQWLGNLDHDRDKLSSVIQYFDVCGVIEVKSEKELPALADTLMDLTSEQWRYVFGTRTRRPSGHYYESFGFLWRPDRVSIGNGIVSNIWDRSEKYRNDPFVATFSKEKFNFAMALLHTRWDDDSEGTREEEVREVADQIKWMRDFVPQDDLLVFGDFNYSGDAEPMVEMSERGNLKKVNDDAKSTYKENGSGFKSAYDHLYLSDSGKETISRLVGRCSTLDTCFLVYGDNDPENMKLARSEISDHLPVVAEFNTT